MVDETMANAARVHAVERGKVASAHSLIAFGGSAPLHIGRLAEKLGIRRIIVPRDAGVGSAVGFLRAPVARGAPGASEAIDTIGRSSSADGSPDSPTATSS